MGRKSKATIEAEKKAREERLQAPVVPGIEGMSIQEARQLGGGVSDEQRLKDLQAQRVELLRAQAAYRSSHQLEAFRPHPKQCEFIRAVLDQNKHTFTFCGGNRTGKTFVACVLAVSLAQGRLPWLPKPKPFTLPAPASLRVLPTGEIAATFSTATVAAARRAWDASKLDVDGITPLPDPPFPGEWVVSKDGEQTTGTFPPGGLKVPGTFDYFRARLQNPPDPGKLRFTPPVKIRVFGEKTDTLAEVQNPKLKQLIAPEWLSFTKKGQTGVVEFYQFANGSQINMLTYQQDPASQEGWDGHVCLFDEPPPRPIYIANSRGLVDHKGIAIFSLTPLKEPWLHSDVVTNPDPAYYTLAASSYDNPYVEKSALDAFFARLSPEELETRRDGKFLHLQGLVFKDYKKEVHCIKPFKPDRAYTVYVAIDTHPRTPHAVVFAAVDQRDRLFVFKEIFSPGTPHEVASWITDFHDNVHPVEMALIDPSSKGDQNRGESTYDVIERKLIDAGIPLELGSKDLQGGILLMQEMFMSQNGIPSLFITHDCERVQFELSRYVWDDWRGAADKSTRTPKNAPKDADDHTIECIRRLIQLPARFVNPAHRALLNRREDNRWQPADDIAGY